MREGMHRGWVGEIVGGNIHSLNRGYGAACRVGDALLKRREFRAHCGLITQTRGHLAHQTRDLRSGLNEPEDVVDEQQHVAMLIVPEVFRHRERAMPAAEAAAWRF